MVETQLPVVTSTNSDTFLTSVRRPWTTAASGPVVVPPLPLPCSAPTRPANSRLGLRTPVQRSRPCGSQTARGANDADVRTRRYFISQHHHFDVVVGESALLQDKNADYLRLYYTEFLGSQLLPPKFQNTKHITVQEVTQLMSTLHPRTRVDAYPVLVLLRDVFARIVNKDLSIIDNEKIKLEDEIAQLKQQMAAKEEGAAERARISLSTLKNVEAQLEVSQNNLQQQIAALKATKAERDDWKGQFAEAQAEIRRLSQQAARATRAQAQVKAVQAEHTKAQNEIHALKIKVEEAEMARSVAELALESAEEKLVHFQSSVASSFAPSSPVSPAPDFNGPSLDALRSEIEDESSHGDLPPLA
mmetsp:Transcript_4288/g.10180  ORF Transcript_4288/g.10180 Transcript_4288/m.10180 type:complete len:360 (-) Transcript_4288:798-1877(-)|eukprot:CAMPEP_0114553868 /NCGR_PEP_ID=MMETSP0114-20121206/7897_1 /TAXON_ID=31324 /ORGANISM="Goniomonas sp, Strain m" /LENGTH=359 /DNA_ID=CAMNT_0001738859 /DNA_START=14 /DNA_END=1093 /DNA_ORIENTATION=+